MAGDNLKKTDDPRQRHPFRGEAKNQLTLTGLTSVSENEVKQTLDNLKEYGLSNYNFQGNPGDIRSVPFIKVTEFQSNYIFDWQTKLNDLLNAGAAGVSELNNLVDAGQQFLPQDVNDKINDTQKKINKILNEVKIKGLEDPILGRPIELIKELFTGRFVASYELPYLGDSYITANSTSDWSNSDGSGLAGTVKSILRSGTNVDYPITPTWNPSDPNNAPPVELELTLYNDSFENLNKNFIFLHAFASGAFWIQDNYRQRQPNIYDVHFPGYFQYFYCALDLTITTKGMKRMLTSNSFKKITSDNGITLPQNTYFPDAYHMTIQFKPLVPNNFNMYLKYLIQGPENDVKIGKERQNLVTAVGSNVASQISKLADGSSKNTVGDSQ